MQERIDSLQYIRGGAALMVVIHHAFPQLQRMGYAGSDHNWLAAAVDVFFVLSGFMMWRSTAEAPPAPLAFLWRRVLRIVPLYWLITSVVVAVLLIAPDLLLTTTFDARHVAASYLFLPAEHPVFGKPLPVLNLGWTLNYEMAFYALFGLALTRRGRTARAAWTLTPLILLCLIGVLVRPGGALAFYTQSLVLEFGLGVLLAMAWQARPAADRQLRHRTWWLVVAGLASFAVMPLLVDDRLLRFGPGAVLVVWAALHARPVAGRAGRALVFLGDASYALYLSHPLVMSAAGQAWRRLGWAEAPAPLFMVVSTALCLAAGLACHVWVERPMTRWLQRAGARPPRVLAAPL